MMDYGTCERCGGNVAEHCIEDATDCVANWPAAGSTPEQRERIHASLCAAPDYGAALALYWWMHLASEHFYGESWPFQWEDQLRAWAEAGLPAGTREPYAGWREEGRRLYAAAGGQWRDASDGRLFVRTEGTLTPAEIEAEAERLFAAWAAPQPHRLDFDMLGELARGPWLAVAEASLAARASLTDAQVPPRPACRGCGTGYPVSAADMDPSRPAASRSAPVQSETHSPARVEGT